MQVLNQWFSQFLYGQDNKAMEGPNAWIVREGKRNSKPETYGDYPNPDSKVVTFKPQGSGRRIGELTPALSATPTTDSPPDSAESLVEDVIDNFSFSVPQLIQAEWSNHRLIYATPKLTEPLHLSGVPRIKLRVACDQPTACLSVWLVSLPWTNSERITDDVITRGWADPANAESIWTEKPMVPGEFRDVEFELQPDDQILQPGEQLGLVLVSSDRDFTLWPEPGTRLQFSIDGCQLDLPIVGGIEAYTKAIDPSSP